MTNYIFIRKSGNGHRWVTEGLKSPVGYFHPWEPQSQFRKNEGTLIKEPSRLKSPSELTIKNSEILHVKSLLKYRNYRGQFSDGQLLFSHKKGGGGRRG